MKTRLLDCFNLISIPMLAIGVVFLMYTSSGCLGEYGNTSTVQDTYPGDEFELDSETDTWNLKVVENDQRGENISMIIVKGVSEIENEPPAIEIEIQSGATVKVSTDSRSIDYIPPSTDYVGEDSFFYTVEFLDLEGDPVESGNDIGASEALVTINMQEMRNPTESTFGRHSSEVSSPKIVAGISSFSNQSIPLGETSNPINFAISHNDQSVDLDSLIVEAHSNNQDVIRDENIELDTSDPDNCSLIVKQNDSSGQARIRVTVRDSFGVSANVSFLIIVRDDSTN